MPAMHKLAATLLTLPALTFACFAQDHGSGSGGGHKQGAAPRAELGTVKWHEVHKQADFDSGLAAAAKHKRPVFLLFQEIPGCATCTGFGKNVLSHPLLKDAIETSFVPMVVRNNVEGDEGKIREQYKEPSWNNPVVRFVDHTGKDLLPRKDRVWDAHGTAARMVATLKKLNHHVPEYLQVALAETAPKTEKAVFEMHCYWEGEAHLGALDGVIKTTSAWVGDAEVVEVVYRPEVISKRTLTAEAQAKSCKPVQTDKVRVAKASDQQHSLGRTAFQKLKLTPMQRTKMHADIHNKRNPARWLSPSQRAQLAKLMPAKAK